MSLDAMLQEGVLVNRIWLKRKGFDRPAVDFYLRSGKLEAVTRGVYRKPGPPLKWQNVVYSLQVLGYQVHVGHFSALQYHGFQHYLTFGSIDKISLYCDNRLPSWIDEFDQFSFIQMEQSLFTHGYAQGTVDVAFGTWDWPIKYSTPERAFIELMSTIRTAEDISQAQMMLEGAANLRPRLLQDLLEQCRQIKAKRLFLWMARTSGHAWYMQIDKTQVDLGSGKRQIVPEGVLDKEFLITVPKEASSGQAESIF
jgi:hypothetical protein